MDEILLAECKPHFVLRVEEEINRIEDDLISLDSTAGNVRNRQRTRKRLILRKEKMKVKLQLAVRDMYSEDISPNEKRSLQYYIRKFETDEEWLYRKLCTELGLTLEDWEPYF